MATRQHYNLATGQGLESAPPKTSNPGYKKGGNVKPKSMKPAFKRNSGRGR